MQLLGVLRNFNTIEDFKNADKAALLDSVGDDVRPFPDTRVEEALNLVPSRSGSSRAGRTRRASS